MLSETKLRKSRAGSKATADIQTPGLYFFPSKNTNGTGKWTLRFSSPKTGKRRDMGLGRYPDLSLLEARNRARAARALLESGLDPIEERNRQRSMDEFQSSIPTFGTAARATYDELRPSFKNDKHSFQWIKTLEQYVFPEIGDQPVDTLRAKDFANVLRPIWLEKPETASRVKQRCDKVMRWCAANEFIIASPVNVVDELLPRQPKKSVRVNHHPSLPWKEVPAFFRDTLHVGYANNSRLLLEFLILTAVRSGEVRSMRWEELDLGYNVWTIPAERMKAGTAHRVPLTPRTLEIIQAFQTRADDFRSSLVAPSAKGTPVSDMTLTKFLRDHNVPSDVSGRHATAHGFRASFRNWASENGFQRDLAERTLAHTIKNQTEAAYHRTDLLEQRRDMMLKWEQHCLSLS